MRKKNSQFYNKITKSITNTNRFVVKLVEVIMNDVDKWDVK